MQFTDRDAADGHYNHKYGSRHGHSWRSRLLHIARQEKKNTDQSTGTASDPVPDRKKALKIDSRLPSSAK